MKSSTQYFLAEWIVVVIMLFRGTSIYGAILFSAFMISGNIAKYNGD